MSKEQIITESPLIGVYRECHSNIEQNFQLPGFTRKQGQKKMIHMFQKLCDYCLQHSINVMQPGHSSQYSMLDMMMKGFALMEFDSAQPGDTVDIEMATAEGTGDDEELGDMEE